MFDDLSEQSRILMYKLQNVIRAARAPIMIYFIINVVASIQIILREDKYKLLTYMILIIAQSIVIMVVAILYYPARWIDHKVEEKSRRKVERRFGKGEREDESTPIVESMNSSFIY